MSIVTEDVVAIIGPTYSYQLFAVFADSQIITSSIPVISTSATADEAAMLGANNFRTSLGVKVYAGSAIDAAIRESKIAQHAIRSVVLASKANDKFTESEVRAFATGLSGYSDLTVTPPITYTTDYSGVVSTVLARKPDLFILSGLIDDGGKILELLTKTTYTGTIIIGNGLNTTEVFQYCGLKCNGIYIAQAYNHAWPNPGNQRFQAAYKRYFDLHYQEDPLLPQQPSQIMAQMYTAVQTIAEALLAIDKDYEKNGKAPLRYVNLSDNGQLQTLRKALIEKLLTTEEDTPESKITFDTPLDKQTWFDKEGDIQQNSYCVARIKMNSANEGEFVILNPTEYGLNCNKPE